MFRYLLFLIAFLLFAPFARAQEEHVYLIKMFDCTHRPFERSQTGFRVRGEKGLITALHGVADCQKIKASRKGLLLDQPLTIKKVDTDHDVALLSSPQIESAPGGGLNVADNIVWESLGTVKVYGHPYGISSLERTLLVSNPPLKPLKDLVPTDSLSILRDRRSPNHLTNVLNLQGHLLPGHSGAPVVDSRGRVVAVANGGLKGGYAEISWAIPFGDIEWDADLYLKLKALAQHDPTILFDYDTGKPIPETVTDFCGQISKLIAASHTKFEFIAGEPNFEGAAGGYKSKIPLPGASASFVVPGNHVRYTMGVRRWGSSKVYKDLVDKLSGCLPSSTKRVAVRNNDPDIDKWPIREITVFKGDDKRPAINVYTKLRGRRTEFYVEIRALESSQK